jgi:hypothetical protein
VHQHTAGLGSEAYAPCSPARSVEFIEMLSKFSGNHLGVFFGAAGPELGSPPGRGGPVIVDGAAADGAAITRR